MPDGTSGIGSLDVLVILLYMIVLNDDDTASHRYDRVSVYQLAPTLMLIVRCGSYLNWLISMLCLLALEYFHQQIRHAGENISDIHMITGQQFIFILRKCLFPLRVVEIWYPQKAISTTRLVIVGGGSIHYFDGGKLECQNIKVSWRLNWSNIYLYYVFF